MNYKLFKTNKPFTIRRCLPCLFLLLCCPAALFAQNGVTISDFSANIKGGGSTLTFNVSWDKNKNMPTIWSDTVWVFIDYNKTGVMTRLPLAPGATLTKTSAPGTGKVVEVSGNDQGVWVVGNARTAGAFSATVQLVTATANLTGTCVYAINYPPEGQYVSLTKIKFMGTPPFYLLFDTGESQTLTRDEAKKPYTTPSDKTLTSFTDASRAPGVLNCFTPLTPEITASATSVCQNGALTLYVTEPLVGATYTWVTSEGTQDGLSYKMNTAQAGAKTATVYARMTTGGTTCQSANAVTMTANVQALPATPVINTSAATVCEGGSLTFYVASPVKGATYKWTASAGTQKSSSYTVNTSQAGAKTATVYARMTTGGVTCQSANAATMTANVQANPAVPEITASAATVCQNGSLTLYVDPPVAGATYTWNASEGSQNGSSYTVTTTKTGAKTATVNAKVTAGGVTCQSANAATMTVKVQALPATPVISTSAATVCQNNALTFNASSPISGATYTWTASAGLQDDWLYSVTTGTAGAKTATVYVRVTAGGVTCQSANAATITAMVQALPATPVISTSAATVCENGSLTFYVTSPVTGATYTWNASEGSQNGSSYTIYTGLAGAKTATVKAKATAGGVTCWSANAATMTANVQARPATPVIGVKSSSTVCQNGSLTFYVTLPVAGATYTWNASAGSQNGSSYTVTTTQAGAKTATVNAKVAAGGVTCLSINADLRTKMVQELPSITLLSGGDQTVLLEDQITPIIYTTTNANGASMSGQPRGLNGSWTSNTYTISGTVSTPEEAQQYFISVTTINAYGCPNASASAKPVITVNTTCMPDRKATPDACVVITGSQGTQQWSGPRKINAGCTYTNDFGATNPPTVAYYKDLNVNGSGNYYNWKCVVDKKNTLCPSPWRVPTQDDLVNLINILVDGDPSSTPETQTAPPEKLTRTTGENPWSGVYVGYCDGADIRYETDIALYATDTACDANNSMMLILWKSKSMAGLIKERKHLGIQVRCVK